MEIALLNFITLPARMQSSQWRTAHNNGFGFWLTNFAGSSSGSTTVDYVPVAQLVLNALVDDTVMAIPGEITYYPETGEYYSEGWRYFDEAGLEWEESRVDSAEWIGRVAAKSRSGSYTNVEGGGEYERRGCCG